ncbi:MAG: TetR/AcrR family transcriptional regulator [Rhodospirillaceae bacterium]
MSQNSGVRPGGRSARVQAAVHKAAAELLDERGRSAVTVPMIAARAGVTPSTIYRRWGDLAELLGDVALRRMRPDSEPADTGSLRGDLEAWLEQYVDETSSAPGKAAVLDILGAAETEGGCRCHDILLQRLQQFSARAERRGEPPLDIGGFIDRVVAPVLYRILFSPDPPDAAYCRALLDAALR